MAACDSLSSNWPAFATDFYTKVDGFNKKIKLLSVCQYCNEISGRLFFTLDEELYYIIVSKMMLQLFSEFYKFTDNCPFM